MNAAMMIILFQRYAGHEPITPLEKWEFMAINDLIAADLLDAAGKITPRGEVLVKHILSLRLPKSIWSMA
jgi:hypothetical protein